MKQFVLLFGFVYLQVVFGLLTEEELPASHKECLAELNVPASELLSTVHQDWTMDDGNENVNNVILCVNKKSQFQTEDGNLDFEKFKNFLLTDLIKQANMKFDNAEEVVTSAVNGCKTIEGSTKGQTLVKTYNCMIKYLRSHEL